MIASATVAPALFVWNAFRDKRRPMREAVKKTPEIVSRLVVWAVLVLTLVCWVTARIEQGRLGGLLLWTLAVPVAGTLALGLGLLLWKRSHDKPTSQP